VRDVTHHLTEFLQVDPFSTVVIYMIIVNRFVLTLMMMMMLLVMVVMVVMGGCDAVQTARHAPLFSPP
jgi:hypothetical protein